MIVEQKYNKNDTSNNERQGKKYNIVNAIKILLNELRAGLD